MDENHSCSAIDDQLNMSQLDMEPEMMFPVRVWNAELDGIENYYHQLKTTEDEAYKSFVEQLELEIQQKREDQMATLNAEIHQYMHSVQVNIDQTLKELKELKLRQLKAEHAKKKLELDNAQKRARVNHLEKLGTEFKFRSQLSPSDPSPGHASQGRQEQNAIPDHRNEPQPIPSREAEAPGTTDAAIINGFRKEHPNNIDGGGDLETTGSQEMDVSDKLQEAQEAPTGTLSKGKRKASHGLEDTPSGRQKRTRRVEPNDVPPDPAASVAGDESNARSRPQRSAAQPKKRSERRTISFDEVYQDGQAEHKHMIIEYPTDSNKWYILRCDEHGVHFGVDPLRGASKHINVAEHGYLQKKFDLAIDILGHVVFDCDRELAEKNNAVTLEYFKNGGKSFNAKYLSRIQRLAHGFDTVARTPATSVPPRLEETPGSTPKATATTAAKSPKVFSGITDPVAGELYLGYWSKTKTKYPILICPLQGDIEKATGIPGTLASINMVTNAPRCIRVRRSTQEIIGWAAGFEGGGQHVEKREFPVVYLDKKQQVGWLAVKHISRFDFEDPEADNIPNFFAARDIYARLRGYAGGYEALAAARAASCRKNTPAEAGDSPHDSAGVETAARRSVSHEASHDGERSPGQNRRLEEAGDGNGSDDAEDNGSDEMEEDSASMVAPGDMETRETTFSPVGCEATSTTAQAPFGPESSTSQHPQKDEQLPDPRQANDINPELRTLPESQDNAVTKLGEQASATNRIASPASVDNPVPAAAAPVVAAQNIPRLADADAANDKPSKPRQQRTAADGPSIATPPTEPPRTTSASLSPIQGSDLTNRQAPIQATEKETHSDKPLSSDDSTMSREPQQKLGTTNSQPLRRSPSSHPEPDVRTRPPPTNPTQLDTAQNRKVPLSIQDILGADVSPIRPPPGSSGSALSQGAASRSLSPSVGRTEQASTLPPRPMSVQPGNSVPFRPADTAASPRNGSGSGKPPPAGYTNGRGQAAGRPEPSNAPTSTSRVTTPKPTPTFIRGDSTDQRWKAVRNPSYPTSPQTTPSPLLATAEALGGAQRAQAPTVDSPADLASAGAGAGQVFHIKAYSVKIKEQDRPTKRGYSGVGLPLTVDGDGRAARAVEGHPANDANVVISPGRIVTMTLDTTDPGSTRSVAVEVAERADAVVQRLEFAPYRVGGPGGRTESGTVQARRFCQWVRAVNHGLKFQHKK